MINAKVVIPVAAGNNPDFVIHSQWTAHFSGNRIGSHYAPSIRVFNCLLVQPGVFRIKQTPVTLDVLSKAASQEEKIETVVGTPVFNSMSKQ